jgi:hypothetical protein
MENATEKEYKYGMMGQNMKEIGKMINQMDMEHFIIRTGMYIKDIGKIIEQMGREYI